MTRTLSKGSIYQRAQFIYYVGDSLGKWMSCSYAMNASTVAFAVVA